MFTLTAESHELAIPSELLVEYNLLTSMNMVDGQTNLDTRIWIRRTRTVRFRLFLHGLPVYTDSSFSTEIVQKWGKNGYFSYIKTVLYTGVSISEDGS